MFSDIRNKSQTSDLGLYKYYDCEDKRRRYRFVIILLVPIITIIILSSVSIIIYNQLSDSYPNYQLSILNDTERVLQESRIHHVSLNQDIIINEHHSDAPHALQIRNIRPSIERRDGDAPRPFFYEIRDPIPTGFQPDIHRGHRAKNIQEIIKYLTDNPPNENTKITSIKKLKTTPNKSQFAVSDPFFPYKPQNPSDINLLATNGLRFAPTIQIEVKTSTSYPSYEVPETPKRIKKKLRKNLRPNPHIINNAYPYLNTNIYPYRNGANDLYSQNNYFQQTRFQANHQHPYWNRPQNFGAQYFGYQHLSPQNYPDYGAQNLGFQNVASQNVGAQNIGSQNVALQKVGANRYKLRPHLDEQIHPSQMILNLNLYSKKKMKENRLFQENCTSEEIIDSLSTKNISELQKLLKQLNTEKDPENKFKINDHEEPGPNSFQEVPQQTDTPPTYEIFKSIEFTLLNPNKTIKNHDSVPFEGQQSQWHPMIVATTVNPEIEDGADEFHSETIADNDKETPTLPMTYTDFERYFTTKPTPKYNSEWDPNILELNPNLVNHNVFYRDKRRRKWLENK